MVFWMHVPDLQEGNKGLASIPGPEVWPQSAVGPGDQF